MKQYLKGDNWNIIEEDFHPNLQRNTESIFTIGNGRMGQRGNFEETYTGDSLKGSYVAGTCYLDRTRVGWWKNGFPKYYSCMPNAPFWSGVDLQLIDEELNLDVWDIQQFKRTLNMKDGISLRSAIVTSPKGNILSINVQRFYSMAHRDIFVIRYAVTSINYTGRISIIPNINGDVIHETSNFNEKMWNIIRAETNDSQAYLWVQTKRGNSQICCIENSELTKNGTPTKNRPVRIEKEKKVGFMLGADVKPGDNLIMTKYVAITSNQYHSNEDLLSDAVNEANEAQQIGWYNLYNEQLEYWHKFWEKNDIIIEGDDEAQQSIRFNRFQILQNYPSDHQRLNIGAKGFSGEKYGGNTQWNTELCVLPFLLLYTNKGYARDLLLYRYYQLPQAIDNAEKLGFKYGAALYPMVTMNGEERHNEWEVTFEEIHRNAIIIKVIQEYIECTNDTGYIAKYGLEVMIAICRFWNQRVTFSTRKQQYMILGVTGPDEYENNVDNNWYTNYSCVQNLKFTLDNLRMVEKNYPDDYKQIVEKTNFNAQETEHWRDIIERMYYPYDKDNDIFMEENGYRDKELLTVNDINPEERPIWQHWSWDRILRSCFIKQSDVLLGMYLYYNDFDKDTIRRNYHFYEPRTVHESSLSYFVHSILAAHIGEIDKAYSYFVKANRLDLDDINNDVRDGIHVTSMPGSWLAIAEGFAGIHFKKGVMYCEPIIPDKWESYSLTVNLLEYPLHIKITKTDVTFHYDGQISNKIVVYDKDVNLMCGKDVAIKRV
jgi:maltose phosphorylase